MKKEESRTKNSLRKVSREKKFNATGKARIVTNNYPTFMNIIKRKQTKSNPNKDEGVKAKLLNWPKPQLQINPG